MVIPNLVDRHNPAATCRRKESTGGIAGPGLVCGIKGQKRAAGFRVGVPYIGGTYS